MKFQTMIACSALTITMLFAPGLALAAASPDGGVDALLELLSIKGIITPEEGAGLREKSAGSAGGGFTDVIELLQRKGAISREEADNLLKRKYDKTSPVKPEKVSEEAVAQGNNGEPSIEDNVKLPEKEIKPVLDVLREQGVLGGDEAEQIKERIGKKWSPSDEDDFIAMEGQEIEYNRSTLPKEALLANIAKLQHQGLITADETERIRTRYLHKLSLERVTDSIADTMKRDVQTQVAERIVPIPEWTRRIKLGGDLRLRWRADYFDDNNGLLFRQDTNTLALANSTTDRYYTQVRARLNITAKITDQLEAGLGMATGNTNNPVSTNATLGDTLNKKTFLLDLAYLKWTPLPELTLWGGRFGSPWFSTDLVWDQDLNFDGVAMNWKQPVNSDINLFFTAGAFPIEEIDTTSHDKWLYGGQIGVNYKYDDRLTATLAAAYYYFDNITGVPLKPGEPKGSTDWSRPKFQQKGNTVFYLDPFDNPVTTGGLSFLGYAAKFHELNINTKIDYAFDDTNHVTLTGDYVNNLGYNNSDVNLNVGVPVNKETEGFQVGLSVGKPETRDFLDWKIQLNYKYLEADAVVDAFTDSDFHLGGTNAKGWIIGADLGLAKNVWMNARWMTGNEISGIPLAIDVFMLNLNAKF